MSSECLLMAMDEKTLTGDLRLAFMAVGDCTGVAHVGSVMRWCNISDEAFAEDLINQLCSMGFLRLVNGRFINECMTSTEETRSSETRKVVNLSKKRKSVFDSCGWKCVYCGSEYDLTIDHKVPRSRGGGNEIENLTCACRSCNSSKGAKTVEEFMAYISKVDA